MYCASVLESIGQGDELNLDFLSPNIMQFLREDNEKFLDEMQAWDLEQQQKLQSKEAEQSCVDVSDEPRELLKNLC